MSVWLPGAVGEMHPHWKEGEIVIDTGGRLELPTPGGGTLWKALIVKPNGSTKWILKKLLDNRLTRL